MFNLHIFSALTTTSKSELMNDALQFPYRASKCMETVVGDLKSETTDGLKCSPEIKKKITSIGTSTKEPNNNANFKCIFD